VKGLLPGEDVQDVDALIKFGKSKGIHPDEPVTNPEIFPQAPPTPSSDVPRETRGTSSSNSPLKVLSKKVPNEKLALAPHGISHYVGPSSSLRFATMIRKMVARTSANPKFMLSQRRSKTLQADFVNSRKSMALEPRNQISSSPIDRVTAQCPQDGDMYLSVLDAEAQEYSEATTFTLPDKATADALVQSFFDNVHPNYPLFHMGHFHQQYETMWNPTKQQIDDWDPGWVCVLCLIFVFGAQALEPFGKQSVSIERRYLRIAQCYVDHLISTTTLQTIQALMLLQLYYHNVGERNASWMLLGCASRMAIALGMHREGANVGFDPSEQNIRRQIWWTVYIFERNLCIILGRPSAIEESEISIKFPEEEIESIGLPSLTEVTALLARLSFRAKQQIYNTSDLQSPSDGEAQVLTSSANDLLRRFQVWYEKLPPHLHAGHSTAHVQQRRAIVLLDILYHHARAFVTRPFLINRVNKQIEMVETQGSSPVHLSSMSDDAVQLADQCVLDAYAVIIQGLRLYKEGLLNSIGWLDVYYIYHSCFIICLNSLPQLADIPESIEDQSRKASVDEILTKLWNSRLAPAFRTMIQVGCQFASLVGALRDIPPDTAGSSQASVEQRRLMTSTIRTPKAQTSTQAYHPPNGAHKHGTLPLSATCTHGAWYKCQSTRLDECQADTMGLSRNNCIWASAGLFGGMARCAIWHL
jgi:hypothetical protein